MTIDFGPIRQIGYAVRDARRAARFYSERLGVGPWFFLDGLEFNGAAYRSQPARGRFSMALANWGDMQLELIQPLDGEMSIYSERLQGNPLNEVMHHVSTWTRTFDADVARASQLGYGFVVEGDTPRGRFCYLEHPTNPGTLIEIAELTPIRERIWAAVAAAASGWDGSDPIRQGWPNA